MIRKTKEIMLTINNLEYKAIITYKRIKNIIYRYKNGIFYISSPILAKEKNILEGLYKFYPRLIKPRKVDITPIKEDSYYFLGELLPLDKTHDELEKYLKK